MTTADKQTIDYYSDFSESVADRYESITVSPLLVQIIGKKETILDIGCGSGRDIAALHRMGHEVTGFDPSAAMIQSARRRHPEIAERLLIGSIPSSLPTTQLGCYDNILINAVLMHIPDGDLFSTALTIRSLMKPGGQLVITISTEREEMVCNNRDNNGRLMIIRSESSVSLLFERIGFQKTGSWQSNDQLGRIGVICTTKQLRNHPKGVLGPISRIESIINDDKKNSTYKYALLRAMCDIAETEYGRVSVSSDGKAQVPTELLVNKWIAYYWPIMGQKSFLPQRYGEGQPGVKDLAFRRSLTDLTEMFPGLGGAETMMNRDRRSNLTIEAKVLLKEVRQKIRRAIIEGPVHYSKGSSDGTQAFDKSVGGRSIVLSSELWREFSLLGHWIRDSLILRWAEETNRVSKDDIEIGRVLTLLLSDLKQDRDQKSVKEVFLSQSNLCCVWSGKSLSPKNLQVDHAIPFSLWRDNSLWNLLPTHMTVNGNKKDKLVTLDLMNRRRDIIIAMWRCTESARPTQFRNGASSLLGVFPEHNWEKPLFDAFVEAVEVTAVRRCVPRWQPEL
jgi:protein-L-isoaspartate O-methyltransferase/5-methylcytosine-specific restriction endonuclease McrA